MAKAKMLIRRVLNYPHNRAAGWTLVWTPAHEGVALTEGHWMSITNDKALELWAEGVATAANQPTRQYLADLRIVKAITGKAELN
jgi:hypothetical protein